MKVLLGLVVPNRHHKNLSGWFYDDVIGLKSQNLYNPNYCLHDTCVVKK